MFDAEVALLRKRGVDVITYVDTNDRIDEQTRLRTAIQMVWSKETQHHLARILAKEQPDVAHFHNTFLLISPAAYYTCQQAGVPVVQTLHNYRLLCPEANFIRGGKICENCMHWPVPVPGIRYGCYRNSKFQTAGVATMLALHRGLGTWRKQISKFIALSEFSRMKFIEGGLPAEKIIVKPNFVEIDDLPKTNDIGGYLIYAGRLSEEKGIMPLLEAWTHLPDIPLQVLGDGPLWERAQTFIQRQGLARNVSLLGRRSRSEVLRRIQHARAVIVPSQCYENCPTVVVEAYAYGVPVLASRIGALIEMVHPYQTGLLFDPYNIQDIVAVVKKAWQNISLLQKMGARAQLEHQHNYTADASYNILMSVYDSLL